MHTTSYPPPPHDGVYQCCGESVSFPWNRICIKNWLDPDHFCLDPDPYQNSPWIRICDNIFPFTVQYLSTVKFKKKWKITVLALYKKPYFPGFCGMYCLKLNRPLQEYSVSSMTRSRPHWRGLAMASLNSSKISLSQKIGFMHICFIVVDPNTLNLDPDPGGNFFIKKTEKRQGNC